MSFYPKQVRDLIVRTLKILDWNTESLVELLMLTMAQESRMGTYLRQLNNGPALGIMQMELATHNDTWDNYLKYKKEIAGKVKLLMSDASSVDTGFHELEFNLAYAIAMAAVLYFRRLKSWDKLPNAGNVEGLAGFWKQYYNTPKGAGTAAEAADNYRKFAGL